MDLYVTESGLFGAPMILYIHGSPLSARMWQPQFDAMKDFHNVAPDLPGHGQSSEIKPLPKNELVESIISLIRQTSPNEKTHLVAYSSGTVIAQAVMAAAPALLDRVVLLDVPPRMSKLWALAHGLNLAWLHLLKPEQRGWMVAAQFGTPAESRGKFKEDLSRYSLDSYMQTWHFFADLKATPDCESPTLIVVGENENSFMKGAALFLSRRLPGGRGVTVPQVGQGWSLQQPDLTNRIIRAWLTNHLLPAGLDPLG